nr:nucleotide-binding protein [Nocardia sp. XZ_19_231]
MDLGAWRLQVEVAIRLAVGDAHPQYRELQEVKFTPRAFTVGTEGQSTADAAARESGILKVLHILEAVRTEVKLTGGVPENSGTTKDVGGKIFIIHGHHNGFKQEVARFIQKITGNEPVILNEQVSSGQTIIEKFEKHASQAAYAVALATADDEGKAKTETGDHKTRARQNVIFELGFFVGSISRSRVALLYETGVELPSDIAGIVTIRLDDSGGWHVALAKELKEAGIAIYPDRII